MTEAKVLDINGIINSFNNLKVVEKKDVLTVVYNVAHLFPAAMNAQKAWCENNLSRDWISGLESKFGVKVLKVKFKCKHRNIKLELKIELGVSIDWSFLSYNDFAKYLNGKERKFWAEKIIEAHPLPFGDMKYSGIPVKGGEVCCVYIAYTNVTGLDLRRARDVVGKIESAPFFNMLKEILLRQQAYLVAIQREEEMMHDVMCIKFVCKNDVFLHFSDQGGEGIPKAISEYLEFKTGHKLRVFPFG